jgi:hypothetical protein
MNSAGQLSNSRAGVQQRPAVPPPVFSRARRIMHGAGLRPRQIMGGTQRPVAPVV